MKNPSHIYRSDYYRKLRMGSTTQYIMYRNAQASTQNTCCGSNFLHSSTIHVFLRKCLVVGWLKNIMELLGVSYRCWSILVLFLFLFMLGAQQPYFHLLMLPQNICWIYACLKLSAWTFSALDDSTWERKLLCILVFEGCFKRIENSVAVCLWSLVLSSGVISFKQKEICHNKISACLVFSTHHLGNAPYYSLPVLWSL